MNESIPWSQLSPNERDAIIAQHIFGRTIIKWREGRVLLMARVGDVGHESIPPYTTSMDAAWKIVEHFGIVIVSKYTSGGYHCELWKGIERHTAIADTAQDAICLAALKAHGLTIEGG